MSFSCATFARKYPLSGRRSLPTIESATWCSTPATRSAARRLVVEVVKKSSTSASANDGEFETSTTTFAPTSTSVSPSPVMVFTPELGEAAIASWPLSMRCSTTLDPMRPVPPMTTIFMMTVPSSSSPYCSSELRLRTSVEACPFTRLTHEPLTPTAWSAFSRAIGPSPRRPRSGLPNPPRTCSGHVRTPTPEAWTRRG